MKIFPAMRCGRGVNLLATTLATAALAMTTGQAAAAESNGGWHDKAKPTIVLVHGAFADGSSWNEVITRLQHDGYTVDAPPNPLRGLPYDSEYIRDFLNTISGPVVLVGHSYGGAVITNAATGDAHVKALVYVDAFIPAEGQTVGELAGTVPGSCIAPPNLTEVPYPDAPPGSADVYLTQSAFPNCAANGLPRWQAAQLAATQRPLASIALGQPSGEPAWEHIPSWAVVGTADHAIPPAEQIAMAETAGSKITEVVAPHLSMISDPGVVTKVILKAVKSTA